MYAHIGHFWLRCVAGYQAAEYLIKDAFQRPTDETVIEGLVRSINFGRVPPSQAIADDVDNSADDTAVIDTRLAVGSWEVRSDTLKLSFGEPVVIRHGQFLLPNGITGCAGGESQKLPFAIGRIQNRL